MTMQPNKTSTRLNNNILKAMQSERFVVTAVVAQKRNKSRCSVFLNDAFAFGCSLDVAERFALRKGKELSKQEVETLQAEERHIALKQAAYAYISYKPRTARQVHIKLVHKGYTPEEAAIAVEFLQDLGYVDDADYARRFARDYLRRKAVSTAKLRQELANRGISNPMIEQTCSELFAEQDAHELNLDQARQAVQKKLRSATKMKTTATAPEKRRQALVSYLQRQGFSWEVIRTVLHEFGGTREHADTAKGIDNIDDVDAAE